MEYESQEEQREGRNKGTIINRSQIDSGEYRRKFDLISDNANLNKLIYQLAKKMLFHRSGTLYEDMYWIDTATCIIVAREDSGKIKKGIKYSRKTRKIIKQFKGLLTIHSHPNSFPPSIDDFNSNYYNNYGIGIVICHDGKIFIYNSEENVSEKYYELLVEMYDKELHNIYKAQILALDKIKENYKINYREVEI